MASFEIYKFDFKLLKQDEMFSKETGKSPLEDSQRLFGLVLKEKLPIEKVKKNKEVTALINYVEREKDDIKVLVVCNEKSLKYKEGKEDKEVLTHPGCRVIIDNRKGIAQMAIERDDSFGDKTMKVRDLLVPAFNKLLAKYYLEIDIRAKQRTMDFWEMVKEQEEVHKDIPTRVTFKFPREDRAPMDVSEDMRNRMVLMRSLADSINAVRGTLEMEASKKGKLLLERVNEDFSNMVSMCCQNGYEISVHFKHYGVYRMGKAVKAIFHLDDATLLDFLHGQARYEDDLISWFDMVRQKLISFEDEVQNTSKRKKSVKE